MAEHLIQHSFLFTNEERESIYRATSDVNTRPVSFVTRLFMPLWRFLSVHALSEQVAPNAITLVGAISSLQAYQIISTYYNYDKSPQPQNDVYSAFHALGVRGAGQAPMEFHLTEAAGANAAMSIHSPLPYVDFFHAGRTVQTATVLAGILLIISIACGSLDGVHAKRCRSATSLGDIFSRICSSLSRVFMALTMLEVMQIDDIATKWYLLLALQLIEFNTLLGRINAKNLKKEKVKNWAYHLTYCFRDSELSSLIVLLLIMRWFFPSTAWLLQQLVDPNYARMGYAALVCITLANIGLLKMSKRLKMGIALCLTARGLPLFYLLPLSDYNLLSVIGDAMVVGLLSIEVYVSHLSNRRIHAAVVLICVGSLLNDVVAVLSSVLYIVGILVDLSYSLNVPIFVPVRNVFIDGVFDLCHAGHKRLMANALRFGNRLVVGVCSDEDCVAYKRRPIMSTEERINEVRLCKYVSEVIPNSPVSGITLEMIKYYNIHVVVCGEEYDKPDDKYYAVPRSMNLLRTVPRTVGISTSALIKRIREASDADVVARDKASGVSTVKDGQ